MPLPWRCSLWRVQRAERWRKKRQRNQVLPKKRNRCFRENSPNWQCRSGKQVSAVWRKYDRYRVRDQIRSICPSVPSRVSDVSDHCDYPDAVLRHKDIHHSEALVASRVHPHIRSVLCKVFYHRGDRVGCGCSGRFAPCRDHLAGVFCKGELEFIIRSFIQQQSSSLCVTFK